MGESENRPREAASEESSVSESTEQEDNDHSDAPEKTEFVTKPSRRVPINGNDSSDATEESEFIRKPTRRALVKNDTSHDEEISRSIQDAGSYSFRNRNAMFSLKEWSSEESEGDLYDLKQMKKRRRVQPEPQSVQIPQKVEQTQLSQDVRTSSRARQSTSHFVIPTYDPSVTSRKRKRTAKNRSKRISEMRSEASS